MPSLLLWERISLPQSVPPSRESRWILDLRRALEASAVAFAVVGAASPYLAGGKAPRTFALVIDETPSMGARQAPASPTRLEAAEAAARALEARLAPENRVLWLRARSSGPEGEDPVAAAAAKARAIGADVIYAFSDHCFEPPWNAAGFPAANRAPRIVPVVLPGGGPNAGIVAAGARAERPRTGEPGALSILARIQGAGAERLLVESRDRGELLAETPIREGIARVRLDPAPDCPLRLRLAPGGDALAEDDLVDLAPASAAAAVFFGPGIPEAVRRALRSAGAEESPSTDRAEVVVELSDALEAERRSGPRIEIARLPGDGPAPERLFFLASALVRYSDPAKQRVRVAPAEPPPGLSPLVCDERGRVLLGTREEREGLLFWVGIPLGMGEAATDWARERSFPAFFAEALAALAPREDAAVPGLYRARGVLDARETHEAALAGALPLPPLAPDEPAQAAAKAAARQLRPHVLAVAGMLIALSWAVSRERLCSGARPPRRSVGAATGPAPREDRP